MSVAGNPEKRHLEVLDLAGDPRDRVADPVAAQPPGPFACIINSSSVSFPILSLGADGVQGNYALIQGINASEIRKSEMDPPQPPWSVKLRWYLML